MAAEMTLDQFLGHANRSSGGSSNFLRGWKKRTPPQIDTVLHTRAPIVALWQHGIPRIQTIKDKDGGERREVWGGTWNCIEPEEVLKKQFFRDRDSGERKHPPTICPVCILLETIRSMIADGVLDFTERLFKFEGDDPTKARYITAAGMCNMYKSDYVTRAQKAEMKKAGIRMTEAWKENSYSKCNYLFVVADVDAPGDGVQVALETTLLGDKVKEKIADQMTSLGEDDGNPLKNPYVIRWEHRPQEKEFQKKYKAHAMMKLEIAADVRRLIFDVDPPDVSGIIAPGNIAQLRATLESHALVTLPWDDIFGPAEAAEEQQQDAQSYTGSTAKTAVDDADADADAEPEMCACDICGGDIPDDIATCPHCGATYDAEGNATPKQPDPPKPKRKRSRSSAARQQSDAIEQREADLASDDDDDDIPF